MKPNYFRSTNKYREEEGKEAAAQCFHAHDTKLLLLCWAARTRRRWCFFTVVEEDNGTAISVFHKGSENTKSF